MDTGPEPRNLTSKHGSWPLPRRSMSPTGHRAGSQRSTTPTVDFL